MKRGRAGLRRGDRGRVDPDDHVVVGDPGDAERRPAPGRRRSAARAPVPGSGRGGPLLVRLGTLLWTLGRGSSVRRRARDVSSQVAGYLSRRDPRIPRSARRDEREPSGAAPRPAAAAGRPVGGRLAGRYAAGGAAVRRAVRGQRPEQPGHRPAPGPLHRPGVAGRQRGPRLRRAAATGSRTSTPTSTPSPSSVDDREVQPLPAPHRSSSRTRPAWCRAPVRASPSRSPTPPTDVIDSTDLRPSTTSSCTSRTSRPSSTRCGRPAPRAVTVQGQRVVSHHRHQVRGATPSSSRACPTPSPTGSPRSATRPRCSAAIDSDHYLQVYREQAADPEHRGRLGPPARGLASPPRRTTACWTSATPSRCAEPPSGRHAGRRPGTGARHGGSATAVGAPGTATGGRLGDGVGERRRAGSATSRATGTATARRLVGRHHDRHRRARPGRSGRGFGLCWITVPLGSVVLD